MPLRVVADTNFLVQALLWSGIPASVYNEIERERVRLVSSRPMAAELARVLGGQKFTRRIQSQGYTVDGLIERVARVVDLAEPDLLYHILVRDPDDLIVIQTAIGGQADLIVTSDTDLLVLGAVEGIAIVRPADLLHTLGIHRR